MLYNIIYKSLGGDDINSVQQIIDSLCITDIRSVTKVNHPHSTHSNMRTDREGSAFAIKKCGSTVYRQNGKKIYSNSSHAVFLPKGATYFYDIEEVGECIMFEVNFAHAVPFAEITSIPLLPQKEVWIAAEKAEKYWIYKKPGYRNKCLCCIYDILSRTDCSHRYVNSTKYDLIKPSISYIESNLSDPDMDTSMLAQLSGISVPYFRKLFYEIYKTPVAKYIETVRIGRACDLLKADAGNIGYIAELSGYRNIYHFSKTFKKVVGVSPGEYRNGHL